MTLDKKAIKNTLLNILLFIWQKVTIFVVVIAFFVGVFFNLWKIQELSIALSLIISLAGAGVSIFAFGKLIKIF